MADPLDERIRGALARTAAGARFDARRWAATAEHSRRRVPTAALAAAAVLIVGIVAPLVALSVLRGADSGALREPGPPGATGAEAIPPWGCSDETAPLHQSIRPPFGAAATEIWVGGRIDTEGEDEPDSVQDRLRVWWNLDPEAWESAFTGDPQPAVEGQLVRELKVQFFAFTRGEEERSSCSYQVAVRAPESVPGTYPIVVLYGGFYLEPAAWVSLPTVRFTVRPGCPGSTSGAECPEAAWIRRIVERADFRIRDESGGGIVVEPPDDAAHARWQISVQALPVEEADSSGLTPASDAAYHELPRWRGAPDVRRWTNGETYTWDEGGFRVWVMPGATGGTVPLEAVDALVYASTQLASSFEP